MKVCVSAMCTHIPNDEIEAAAEAPGTPLLLKCKQGWASSGAIANSPPGIRNKFTGRLGKLDPVAQVMPVNAALGLVNPIASWERGGGGGLRALLGPHPPPLINGTYFSCCPFPWSVATCWAHLVYGNQVTQGGLGWRT